MRGRLVLAVGLVAAGLTTTPAPAAHYTPGPDDYYINYAAPRDEPTPGEPNARARSLARRVDQQFPGGNPIGARVLAAREAQAIRTGRNPAEFKHARTTRTARMLTLLVEFNDAARDDFSGFSRLRDLDSAPYECVEEPPGTLKSGPLHNRIPNPATLRYKDDNSFWVKDFSPAHYTQLLYSDRGVTTRVRTDLKDPRDGRAGIDISGYTLKKMYEEMSKGAYSVTGTVAGWLKVPHSEAWYGAAACGGAPQDMSGHPANPAGVGQLVIDAVDALARTRPTFPWADYDREDASDADGDGNLDEPDGVLDHVVIVHAGKDRSSDGGAQGTYALWANSSAVAGGHRVPGTALKVSNYMLQAEDAGVGIFAHEYGHDLGLPDLYDTTGYAASDVDFWDLMASGSHTGPLYQSMPAHMGLWEKWVLGWANPQTFNPGDAPKAVTIGQSSRTPRLTRDGIRVNLGSEPVKMIDPHSGAKAWWSGEGTAWVARSFQVPPDARLWMWNNYELDSGAIEVSADGGATWTQEKVFDSTGGEVALSGSTPGWRRDYVSLAAYAGKQVKVRLTASAGPGLRGWHADDFQLTSGEGVVWSDDVEGGSGPWSAHGWTVNDGFRQISRFYLAEWRNFDGFDKGLRYAYDTSYVRDGAWKVEKLRYNAPGLLVWYRDSTYPTNILLPNLLNPPSIGSKGSLLLVDAHFDPLRRTGKAAQADPTRHKNLESRAQSSNAAFGFIPTYPFKECFEGYCTKFRALRGVGEFADARTWVPGFEVQDGTLYYRDFDASAVVPAAQPYSTRVVNVDGTPATDWYGLSLGDGHVLGTGHPGSAALGVRFKLIAPLPANLGAVVSVVPPRK